MRERGIEVLERFDAQWFNRLHSLYAAVLSAHGDGRWRHADGSC